MFSFILAALSLVSAIFVTVYFFWIILINV